jgi:hypothetical protein
MLAPCRTRGANLTKQATYRPGSCPRELGSSPGGDSSQLARFHRLWEVREEVAEPHSRIVQAKALILCSLPYLRTAERSVLRTARISRTTRLSVTFTSIDENVPVAFGADRALLGWIQTRGYDDGFVSFNSLTEFFRAFGLSQSGREYLRFRERLRRLESLSITVRLDTDEEAARVNLQPIKKSFTPRTSREARERLAQETAPQLMLVKSRYGFQLDPDFWEYLKANPVPLPLALMRLFHNRPKAWDLTAFVLYRSYAARTPSVVPWQELLNQMGSTDRYPHRLKATFTTVLDEIRVVYPTLGARFLRGFGGLQIEPWRPT